MTDPTEKDEPDVDVNDVRQALFGDAKQPAIPDEPDAVAAKNSAVTRDLFGQQTNPA